MRFTLLYPLLLIALCVAGFRGHSLIQNPPMYFSMAEEWKEVDRQTFIGAFQNLDTLLEHELYLLFDQQDKPLLFYTDVITPVCIDGICKPVYIELYWNLVGHYVGYGVYPEQPLTKFDHDEFTAADYDKLHRLLSDNKSVLRRKKLSDLFDENAKPAKKVEYKGEEIDAVSGATKKEIKESIIEGALYSCYTLWHLVHGEAADIMESALTSRYSGELERAFLNSGYEDYHFYALKQMNGADFEGYLPRIMEVFEADSPLTRTYILKKMPKELIGLESVTRGLYGAFAEVDINSRTLLINNLAHAHAVAPELLSGQVMEMSKNQLRTYLQFLAEDESRINSVIQKNLDRAASSSEYAYGYLIGQMLN